MNLEKDLKRILIKELTQFGENVNTSSNIGELARKHFNLQSKMISQHPRNIYKSKEFMNKEQSLGEQFQIALDIICEKLKTGKNVCNHLSKKSIKPNYTDLLLTDWSLHHLHISNTKKKPTNQFYDPSDWLFFALIKPSDAYLIDMHLHKTPDVFAKKDLLKVVYRNWPEIMEPFELKGIPRGSRSLSDKDISVVREKSCNVFQEIDGKVFAPMGGAISSAGTNINHTEDATDMLLKIKLYEQRLTEEKPSIKAQLKNKVSI